MIQLTTTTFSKGCIFNPRNRIFQSPLTRRNGDVSKARVLSNKPFGVNLSSSSRVPSALLQHETVDDYTAEAEAEAAPSFVEVFEKKLNGIAHLTRPYTWINTILAITSVSLLPMQSLSDVTPTFLIGLLKAIIPTVLMNIFVCAVNQITDADIDKINKPYLPLASGELSKGTALAICVGCVLTSLGMGVMSGSPALLWAQIVWFLTGAAYSIPLPFMRWKSHTFMAPFSLVIFMGLLLQIPFFIHSQQCLLGRPFVISSPIIFTTAIMSIFAFVNGILKDLPDFEGDKAFGMRTMCVLLGKEKVLKLCVNLMLIAYGSAIVGGAFSSSMLNKSVTIIGHGALAFMMWLRSRKVDFGNFESQFGFYMYLWKLNYLEYFLIHFLR